MTYLLPLAVAISVNSWTLRCIADALQDGGFSRVCSTYDENSELELWKLRVGLLCIHWSRGWSGWKDGVRNRSNRFIDLNDFQSDLVTSKFHVPEVTYLL